MEINKIYNTNCLDGMKDCPDNFIDLTVTSPPYDNLRDYKDYTFDFEGVAKELYRITKEGGVVVWVVNDSVINGSESGTSFKQALYFKEIGFNIHDTMIYEKDGGSFPDGTRYQQCFEYMFVFSKGKPKTFNSLMTQKKESSIIKAPHKHSMRMKDGTLKVCYEDNSSTTCPRRNIWRYNIGWSKTTKDDYAYEHPAMYPEKLAEDHILSWSNEGDLVLDPFMGSGTTAKMAIKNGRNYIGFEISEEYCKIIERRIKDIDKKVNEQKNLLDFLDS